MLGIGLFLYVVAIVVSIVVGLIARQRQRRKHSMYEINSPEMVVGSAIVAVLASFVVWAGMHIAHGSAAGGFIKYENSTVVPKEDTKTVKNERGTFTMHRVFVEDRFGGRFDVDVPEWQRAKQLEGVGKPPGGTRKQEYDNSYLAASFSLRKAYAGDIDLYKGRELLGPHTQNYLDPIVEGFKARKVVFRGFEKLHNEEALQDGLTNFNGQLGSKFDGDIHVFVVPSSKVGYGESYKFATALLAHWERDFGKHGLAENAMTVVMGVNDTQTTIDWAKAITGLPQGNEGLVDALSYRLNGQPFTAEALFGQVTLVDGKITGKTEGLIERLALTEYPFESQCANCGITGFLYLSSEISISVWAGISIVLAVLVVAVAVWLFFARFHFFEALRRGWR